MKSNDDRTNWFDDDIREGLHAALALCSEQEFLMRI